MRLNRYLAAAGLGSRRSCEALILSGEVSINGVPCNELATQVNPQDVVKVGNRVVTVAQSATIILHKPPGYLSTASDTHGRRTVFDLLPAQFPRLFHVGRLDKESEGLMILTNDGDLSLKLTHPRYKVDKEYTVVLDKQFDFSLRPKLLHGVNTPEGFARMESIHRLANNKLKVVLRQGLKRQIRHMFYEVGYEVIKLVRTRIGPLELGSLPPGGWRVLSAKEIDALLAAGKPLEGGSKPSRPAGPKPSAPAAKGANAPSRPANPKAATPPPPRKRSTPIQSERPWAKRR